MIAVLTMICGYYLEEGFDSGWDKRWIASTWKTKTGEAGTWEVIQNGSAGGPGLSTRNDSRFYTISSRFPQFSNRDTPIHVQYTVKHTQSLDCGGGYLKLFPSTVNQEIGRAHV